MKRYIFWVALLGLLFASYTTVSAYQRSSDTQVYLGLLQIAIFCVLAVQGWKTRGG